MATMPTIKTRRFIRLRPSQMLSRQKYLHPQQTKTAQEYRKKSHTLAPRNAKLPAQSANGLKNGKLNGIMYMQVWP